LIDSVVLLVLTCCMAKQTGAIKIKGTVSGICFYSMGGVFYARIKSSLTGERVRTDPAFTKTMQWAGRMGTASKIASLIYRATVPTEEQTREKFREVVSRVLRALPDRP